MQSFLWNLFEISINISEILMVFVLFIRKLGLHNRKLSFAVLGGIILVLCTVTMNKMSISAMITPIITAVLFIIYALVCFAGNISSKILWSCVASVVFVASNFITTTILGFVSNNLESVFIENSFARIEALLLYVLLNLTLFTILYSINRTNQKLPSLHKILMVSLIIVNVSAMSILMMNSVLLAGIEVSFVWCSIASGLILFSSIGQVALFFGTSNVYNKYIDTETELKTLEAEAKHAEKMAEVYSEIRKWKHDYNNQMAALSTIALNSGCTEVTEYIEKMTGVFAQLVIINTGNPIIDAVLSDKIQTAEKCDIHVA